MLKKKKKFTELSTAQLEERNFKTEKKNFFIYLQIFICTNTHIYMHMYLCKHACISKCDFAVVGAPICCFSVFFNNRKSENKKISGNSQN